MALPPSRPFVYEGDTPPSPNKPQPKAALVGCLAVVVALAVVLAVVGGVLTYAIPKFFSHGIRGDFLAMLPVPGPHDQTKLWIYTDRSFNYSYKSSSGGSTRSGTDCIFCKTSLYTYDPERQSIDREVTRPFDGRVSKPAMYLKEGKVWVVGNKGSGETPHLAVYDAATGAQEMDEAKFAASLPQLASGFVDLKGQHEPDRIEIATKDGQALVYGLDEGQLLSDGKAAPESDEQTTIFAVSGKPGEARKALYRLTGPKSRLHNAHSAASYAADPSQAEFFLKSTSEPVLPGRFFIEAMLLYQDAEIAVILHQLMAGDDSDRVLTCVDSSGKVRWTVPQADLFKKMRREHGNSFSQLFFMESNLSGQRVAKDFILGMEKQGAIAFDVQTGKQRWKLDL